jgi:hypothetical protein
VSPLAIALDGDGAMRDGETLEALAAIYARLIPEPDNHHNAYLCPYCMKARRADLAEAWERGYTSGHSNAMRQMSDEPDAPTTVNPYLDTAVQP